MTMKKTLFVVSDVHGHYAEMRKALDDAGFCAQNDDHVFVSCGDLFDRGKENNAVYDFVRGLKNKILIRGNHEDMLSAILQRGYLTETDVYNGTDITVSDMLGADAIDGNGYFDRKRYTEKITELRDFIDGMLDYYETENYVVTHGWLPLVFEGYYPQVDPDWRSRPAEDWLVAHVLEWQQLYGVGALLEGKTIVCGHRPARLGSMFDDFREYDCSEPFYGKGMTAIDAGTVRSGRVNVLVIKEDRS
jgi:hypothetical protein